MVCKLKGERHWAWHCDVEGKSLHLWSHCSIAVLAHIQVAPFLVQFPANSMRNAAEDGTADLVPVTLMGDLDEGPGSWLPLGSVLATGE